MAKKTFNKKAGNDNNRPTVGLALQGSGAHGAFTWGVIEGLLDCGVNVKAICGTSSGAFNGALAASGLTKNDPALAKQKLRDGWKTVSMAAIGTVFRSTFMERSRGIWPNLDNPAYNAFKKMSGTVPVEQWNVMGINPMRYVVRRHVDFDAINNAKDFKFFCSAASPKIKQLRIFGNKAISEDTLAASSNLRQIMPPVYVNGEELWDGGFMENPSITPLVHNTKVSDIITVMIHPTKIKNIPKNPAAIERRKQQMLYSSGPYQQMAGICHMNDLIRTGALDPKKCKERLVNTHLISMPEQKNFGTSSLDNLDWEFLTSLHDTGYQAAQDWFKKHGKDLGKKSTYDPRDNKNGTVREYGFVHGEDNTPPQQKPGTGKNRGLNPS